MSYETQHPVDEADWLARRTHDLTSTDISALFGCSPYCTPFELWHRKQSGAVVTLEPSERMKWGSRMQEAIAAGIAEEQGWTIRRMTEYLRLPEQRLGASFDFSIEPDGLLEVKNVDALQYKDGWLVEGENVEAPAHIELQVQHQLLVSGRAYSYLGALVGGNRIVLQRREPNAIIHGAIQQKAKAFWASIDAHQSPAPDFVEDAGFLAALYNYAEPGKVISGDEAMLALAHTYRQAQNAEKIAKAEKDSAKAQLLTLIGDAEKVRGEGFTISAGLIGPQHIEYDRGGYRDFRVIWKKFATQEVVNG